jgi:hypothetical protein
MHLPHTKTIRLVLVITAILALAGVFAYQSAVKQSEQVFDPPIKLVLADDRVIDFTFTDDNQGEDLIIRTDKRTYYGFNSAIVYFSITNTTKNDQDTDIYFWFEDEVRKVTQIERLNANITNNDKRSDDSQDISSPDALPPRRDRSGSRYLLADASDINRDLLVDTDDTRKPVNGYTNGQQTRDTIESGQTNFYLATITYPPQSAGKFFIEAFGYGGKEAKPLRFDSNRSGLASYAAYGHLDPWYSSSWNYRKKITIEADQVESNEIDFPVLATTTDTDFRHTDNGGHVGSSTGADILFTQSDGKTLLNYEREYYSSSTGKLVAWIRTDISSTTDTDIYIYYGNANVSQDQATTTGVWDDNYIMVLHSAEDPTISSDGFCGGGSDELCDSSRNYNHANWVNVNNNTTRITGQIDYGVDNDGAASGDRFSLPSGNGLNITGTQLTLSGWARTPAGGVNSDEALINKTGTNYPYMIGMQDSASAMDMTNCRVGTTGGDGAARINVDNVVPVNTWTYLVCRYDGSTLEAYVDGSFVGEDSTAGGNINTGTAYYLASRANTRRYEGDFDELRVSDTVRSVGWIKTEYNNQKDVNTFMTFGSEEDSLILTQAAYRWFANDNSTDVGSALAAQDTATTSPAQGTPFRLRLLIYVSDGDLATGTETFKLQVAQQGTDKACDTAFSGETYADVAAGSGAIRYYNNSIPADGDLVTDNVNDPSYGGYTNYNQTYEEVNNFTATTTIASSSNGLWDFALINYSAATGTAYCFRVVKSDNSQLDTYTKIPAIATADVTIGSRGSQDSTLSIPATNQHVGGMFVLRQNTGSTTVQSITITETGTVDAQNDLDNIKLYYDLDTTYPYNCASESYGGGEDQFGATDTDGFSSANGTSTFSSGVSISTTSAMCLYPVLDIASGMAVNGKTLALQIVDPPNDVILSGTIIGPENPVGLGVSTLDQPAVEFTSIIDPDNADGTDYSNLTTWAELDVDLVATTTMVFSYNPNTASGTIPDHASVVGQLSGAIASSTHMTATTTSAQILLENISGTFQSNEQVYLQSTGASSTYVFLTNAGDPAIAVAKCRSTGGSVDNAGATISGWETSSTTYIKIWTDPDDVYGRHQGIKNTGYTLAKTSSRTNTLNILDSYTVISGIEITSTGIDTNADNLGIDIHSQYVFIHSCIIYDIEGANNYSAYGIFIQSDDADISNTIIHDITGADTSGSGLAVGIYPYYSDNTEIKNCTINNITYTNGGLYSIGIFVNGSASDDVTVLNTVVTNISAATSNQTYDNYGSGTLTIDYSIDDDGYGGIEGGNANGAITTQSDCQLFLDPDNKDFHIKDTNSDLNDAGDTSLLWTEAYYDDIDETARGSAWDIGADEVPMEFVSTICENTSAGGDCANMDYSSLGGTGDWESAVDCDLTPTSTRVFSGAITGNLDADDLVYLYDSTISTTTAKGNVVATTSDQILIDNIVGSSTNPVITASGSVWRLNASNYWTVTGATTTDELGASPIAVAKIDGSWSASDTQAVTIGSYTDWGTDNDNYIKIYTTDIARHDGKWNYNKYRLVTSGVIITIYTDYVRIDGLQFYVQSSSDNMYSIKADIKYIHTLSDVRISNNIITAQDNTGQNVYGILFDCWYSNKPDFKIWNNIIYNFDGAGNAGIYTSNKTADPTIYAYNNTVYNCETGIEENSGTIIAINNIVQNSSSTDFSGVSGTFSDYNISSDWTAPGTNSQTTTTVTFISTSTSDFHLSPNDTAAKDAGIDLSSTSTLNFTDDIDGGSRFGTWDIGADEVATKIYRSVGNTSADLKNAATVTIATTTATFSAAQPDNVGVGDVIQYGTSTQLAFITARASSTEYNVQAWDGSTPTATTSAAVSIYRAYRELDDWEDHTVTYVNSGIDESVDDYVAMFSQDLVASDTIMMVPCYYASTVDNDAVTISGWTTGERNYIKIYTPVNSNEVGTSQRHTGKWDTGKYRLEFNGYFYIFEDYVKVDGLQVKISATGDYYRSIFTRYQNTNNEIQISNNIIKISITSGWNAYGIYMWDPANAKIWNNIIYKFGSETGYHVGMLLRGGTNYVYNNTIVDMNTGYYSKAGSNVVKNNIAQNCNNGFYLFGGSWSGTNNLSDIAGDAVGSNPVTGNVLFLDEANDDFHLAPTDTSAIDAGTSSPRDSSDPAGLQNDIIHDIDGHYRRQWDIGADEASVEFVATIQEDGSKDFSTLASWENGVDCDLTATTTAVFSATSSAGQFQPYSTSGRLFIGQTSGATGQLIHISTSTSNQIDQILLVNLSGDMVSGEDIGDGYGTTTLSNNGNPAIAVAKIDGAWTSADQTAFDISGWETDSDHYIKIYTTETARHNGKWDVGKYRLDGTAGGAMVDIYEDFVWIDGLQVANDQSISNTPRGIATRDSGNSNSEIKISNNIVYYDGNETPDWGENGIHIYTGSYSKIKIWNNIVYDWGYGILLTYGTSKDDVFIYNNTSIDNTSHGFYCRTGINLYLKNNISYDNATDYYTANWTSITAYNNLSEDDTADNDGGTDNKINQTVNFTDQANDDFHLSLNDTAAKNAGGSLMSDPYNAFYDDIDGTSRGASPDIGADEVPMEFVSTICQATSTGGDCVNMDYNTLSSWETALAPTGQTTDLTATSTRVFSGSITGNLDADDLVYLFDSTISTTTAKGNVVATTSDQILIDNITASGTNPVTAASGSVWRLNSSNYWTITGATTTDELGASPIAIAKIDGSWIASDTQAVTITDWTTDNDNYIRVYTTSAARHQGKWDEEKYRLNETSGSGISLEIKEHYTRIEGLQLHSSSVYSTLKVQTYGDGVQISHCIFKCNIWQQFSACVYFGQLTSTSTAKMWNNLVYDAIDSGESGIGVYDSKWTLYLYNNTVHNTAWRAIDAWKGIIIAKNNLLQSCGGDCFNSTDGIFDSASTNNVSDDSTYASSTADFTSTTVTFVSTSTADFHLSPDDTSAKDAGTDLSSDADLNFTTDIDGYTRPYNDTWDIGADEYSMGIIYRSVGPSNTSALACGSGPNKCFFVYIIYLRPDFINYLYCQNHGRG